MITNIEKIEIYPKQDKIIFKYDDDSTEYYYTKNISYTSLKEDENTLTILDIHADVRYMTMYPPEGKLLNCIIKTYQGATLKKVCTFVDDIWYNISMSGSGVVKNKLLPYYNVESWEVIQ